MNNRVCLFCSRKFMGSTITCSEKCRVGRRNQLNKKAKAKIEHVCRWCDAIFHRIGKAKKRKFFCSARCANKSKYLKMRKRQKKYFNSDKGKIVVKENERKNQIKKRAFTKIANNIYKKYTESDIKIITDYSKKTHDIALELGRTQIAIAKKRRELRSTKKP